MSAAATAAGYLYASGRLRGRAQRDQDPEGDKQGDKPASEETKSQRPRVARAQVDKPVRVAAIPAREDLQERGAERSGERSAPRRVPTVQYRTRRWRPEQPNEE